jgi:hypothetical protein
MLAEMTEKFVLVLFVLSGNVFQGCVERSAGVGEHASGTEVKERGDESCYDVFHFCCCVIYILNRTIVWSSRVFFSDAIDQI